MFRADTSGPSRQNPSPAVVATSMGESRESRTAGPPAGPRDRSRTGLRRAVLWSAVVLALLVIVVPRGRATVMDAVLRHMLYPAPPVRVPEQPPSPLRPVALSTGDDETVSAWESPAPDAPPGRPVAIFFHGNGENLETMRRAGLFLRLDELDLPYLAVDYPGYGRSTGRPSEESLLAGAEAALQHVRRSHPDRPVVAVGWSLGAAVSIRLAARHPEDVEAIALLSPWTTLADVAAKHFPAFLARPATDGHYDSLAAAEDIRVPALVVHGSRDRIIPSEQGERLARALAETSTGEIRWVPVDSAGHNDLLAHEAVWRELERLFTRSSR